MLVAVRQEKARDREREREREREGSAVEASR
jgi:hypothetical protein